LPSDLLKAVNKLDNLERAWRVIQQNGRSSKSETVRLELERFAEDAPHNLRSLMGRLVRGSFKFGKAKGVPIPKLDAKGKPTGGIRPIVLAPVESRIVQRAVLNVLIEIEALKPYIKTPYSFGGIRSNRQRNEQERAAELSAVPAAIQAVLAEIGQGARFTASADIRAFFTRISKEHVLTVIGDAIGDGHADFLAFLRRAITVELENLALLKEKAANFPTEEIGVAQGNSLSPLLGNIALAEFDRVMNEGDCHCIRYIDDFIIMAPTQKAANSRLAKAIKLLAALQMELSPEKSSKGGSPISDPFDFLGITICPGLIRPSAKAQYRFIESVTKVFLEAQRAMVATKSGQPLERDRTLIATLKRVDGMIDGWGKHYWFCNDGHSFAALDKQISEQVAAFLGCYRTVRASIAREMQMSLLGLPELGRIKREPFSYPQLGKLP
jgi:RNA-directed DNA polymerase